MLKDLHRIFTATLLVNLPYPRRQRLGPLNRLRMNQWRIRQARRARPGPVSIFVVASTTPVGGQRFEVVTARAALRHQWRNRAMARSEKCNLIPWINPSDEPLRLSG